MSTNPGPHKSAFQLERIALFSDAVFAIAITLLIIEIKVPSLPDDSAAFSHAFGHAMSEMIPEFIGFFISFAVIGTFWRQHHTLFGYVTDYDRKLIRLNNLLLLTIVSMPFTTAFMSRYMAFQPFFIYSINVMVSGLLQIRLWQHVTARSALHGPIPAGMKKYKIVTPVVTISCFALAMLVHVLPFWEGNWGAIIARALLILVFFISRMVDRHFKKKYKLDGRA